jgi:YVTN family beta-propeller protein
MQLASWLPTGVRARRLCVTAAALLAWSLARVPSLQASCAGDCDGGGRVTITELINAVNIALGSQALSACPAADADGNGSVDIADLIKAVSAALTDCATPLPVTPPTATATATDTAHATPTETPTQGPTPTDSIAIFDLGAAAVVNELDRSVSFVPKHRGRQAGTPPPDEVPIDAVPRAIAIGSDGQLAYVTTREPDGVQIIDIAARRVAGPLPGTEAMPEAIACTPDGSAILVTNFGSHSVSIIDERRLRARLAAAPAEAALDASDMSTAVQVDTAPNGIAITTDSARALVTNYGSGSLSVIDIASRTMMKRLPVGDNPNSVAITPDGKFAYVSNFTSMTLNVVDLATNTIVGPPIPINQLAETHPTALAFSPGGYLYVTSFNVDFGDLFGGLLVINTNVDPPQAVTRIDFRTQGFANALPAATRVNAEDGVALISNFLFERDQTTAALRASAAGGTLLMIDTATNSMVDSMPVGNFPVNVAVGNLAAAAATPTETPGPSPTPTVGERCAMTRCLAPAVCTRDLGCHRNGCMPRDKCCPPDDPDCLACDGGEHDGMACAAPADCPDGVCRK